MRCPSAEDWDLLAMEILTGGQAESMLAHARACDACRTRLEAARRAHIDRVRTYEAFDRDHDELREQLMTALPDELPRRSGVNRLVRGWARLGDHVMSLNKTAGRRAAAVLVPAACILIAVSIFLAPGQKSAFAAAIEHLRQAKTIVCRITMPEGLQFSGVEVKAEGKMQISSEHGSRIEMYVNDTLMQLQYTPLEGPSIIVTPPARSYFEFDVSSLAPDETAARTPSAWVQKLRELEAKADRELGRETTGGHEAVGFEIDGKRLGFTPPAGQDKSNASMEIWVVEDSGLPVQMKIQVPMPGQDKPLVVVMDQFEWDVPVDAALFKPDIPEDFIKLDLKFARPSEETLLNTLKTISELTGGRYTSSLQSVSTLAELPTLLSDSAKEKLHSLGQQGMMQLGVEINAGGMYYMKLVKEGHEPEYFGDSVTAEDADKVLLRWKLDDGQTRVIYGDLRVETRPADR